VLLAPWQLRQAAVRAREQLQEWQGWLAAGAAAAGTVVAVHGQRQQRMSTRMHSVLQDPRRLKGMCFAALQQACIVGIFVCMCVCQCLLVLQSKKLASSSPQGLEAVVLMG
jgi:hypothetical protein